LTVFLANLFLFFLLVPYLSFPVFDSDVQPVFAFVAILLLFLTTLSKRKIKFDRVDLVFFAISLYSVLFISLEDDPVLKKQIGLLVAFLIYYTYKRYKQYLSINTVYLALSVLISGAIFQYFFPEIFASIFENFINHIRYHPEQGRGLTSLTPEPGFFAASLTLISFILSSNKMKRVESNRKYYFIQFAIIFFLLMTKSLASIIFLALILINLFGVKKSLMAMMLVFIGLYGSAERAGVILDKVRDGEILSDKSIAHRVSNLYTAWYAITNSPLGHGSGSFKRIALVAEDDSNSRGVYLLDDDSALVIVSSFSRLTVEMGFIFILFLFYFYIFKHKVGMAPKLASFFMLFVTFPIVYPGIWILLCLDNIHKKH